MDAKFQTSFIPKRPLTAPTIAPHHGGMSIFMVLSVVLFIVSIAGGGLAIGWKNFLQKQQNDYKTTLERSRNQFNPELIEQLKKANTKIDLSKQLLKNHLAVSGVFDIIARLTAENIRFNSLDFSAPIGSSPTAKDGVRVTMRGVGTSFSAIAFQSDVFGQSAKYGKNKLLKNPVLSDLAVDQNGNVAFSFTATLNSDDLSYIKTYEESIQGEAQSASAQNAAAAAASQATSGNNQ